ncbi:MAG: electron transporter RnfG, partial [Synergistaceae bacterium]|nr:electron transporter RnfG [Synergistaceae bacterium]
MNENIKKALHLGGTLFAVTAVTGLILGVVEHYTSQAIARVEAEARNAAFRIVMPAAQDFATFELKEDDFVADVQ